MLPRNLRVSCIPLFVTPNGMSLKSAQTSGFLPNRWVKRISHSVCVALPDSSCPARMFSILALSVPSGSMNCMPTPLTRVPWALAGVIHTTLPATGIFSGSSNSLSKTNTSLPSSKLWVVHTNRPPYCMKGIYAAYKTVSSVMVSERTPFPAIDSSHCAPS